MIEVTYYYSACVGIRTPEASVLCDPWFTDGVFDGSWYQYPKLADPLGVIGSYDYVYISHIHPDHYDPIFLRMYLASHPSARIIIGDFPLNFLSNRMQADHIPHEVCEKISIGETIVRIIPNQYPSGIDSALVVKRGEQSVANMNDNLYNEDHLEKVRGVCGAPTIALTGYTGAGPYPQTFYSDPETLAIKAAEKREEFFQRYLRMQSALKPQVTVPFAGQYILGGRLHVLNKFRGVSDAVEVTGFDPTAVVLQGGGQGSIATNSLRPTAERTTPFDLAAMESYAASLADRPMLYDTYFGDMPLQTIPFRRLLPKAYENASRRSACSEDSYICIKLGGEWVVANVREGSAQCLFTSDVSSFQPRWEIEIDPRYLYGLVTGLFHWNNASIGSHFTSSRTPDIFNRDAVGFLNFFHV
ncbi:MAG: UDP-MurNAc hydroxylase [Chloroflexi bacterium]|nr:MAG: UDP-MurNAc hydroxylase [Chloroflexota bacterium]